MQTGFRGVNIYKRGGYTYYKPKGSHISPLPAVIQLVGHAAFNLCIMGEKVSVCESFIFTHKQFKGLPVFNYSINAAIRKGVN
jgi:hypothetical protein